MALQQTYNIDAPRADFNKPDFDDIVGQKGRRVLVQKAIMCPCKSPSVNNLSDCRNCGGTGWAFVNAKETRMVIQKINLVNDFAPWSEENRGFANASFNSNEYLTYMDKITLIDGIAVFNQVCFIREKADTLFTFTTYPIKEMVYVGMWVDNQTKFKELKYNVDYVFERNIIKLLDPALILDTVENTSITIRYIHSPVFHLIEMKRETMETFQYKEGEVLYHMPVSAIIRRAHYIADIENLSSNRLINNDFNEGIPVEKSIHNLSSENSLYLSTEDGKRLITEDS